MKELLSPAGDIEGLKAAIFNGADAVYISGKNFGARKYAKNFTKEELKEAISLAHLYNVKVYITVNTVIYENEINEFLNYINYLYLIGADSIIIQDIGMIHLIRKKLPDFEIHISTQGNNCNDYTLKYYKNLGVKRVVLARELSLKEINNLKTNIDKEVFIHGALCICYSGCCLFSSLNGNRSGNRGMCAGPCRLPYTLIKNDKIVKTKGPYLLSPKELNTSDNFKEILNSNIQSFKIEGRMKSPSYVAYVTKMYRNLIDKKNNPNNTQDNLKKIYNRNFTLGHLFNKTENELMNSISPNHIGLEIGKVININNKYIKIKINDNLSQNDGIRFLKTGKGMIINKLYNDKGLLINKASKGDIILIDNKINLKTLDKVSITYDYNLMKELLNFPSKKININFKVYAKINKPLSITIIENNHKITLNGNIITKAINKATTKEEITKKLSKLGNTPFYVNNINFDIDDNIFIPISEINNIRRNLVNKLTEKKLEINRKITNTKIKKINIEKKEDVISAYTNKENVLKYLLNKIDMVYTDDLFLYNKYKCNKLYYRLDRTNYNLPDFHNENLVITEIGSLYKYSKDNNCIGDYSLNINNSYSANYLEKEGLNYITLSPELDLNKIKMIAKNSCNIKVIIYGTLELMVIKHCIIKTHDNCPSCKNNNYYLLNKKGEKFKIITKNCKNHIMHHEKINLLKEIKNILKTVKSSK